MSELAKIIIGICGSIFVGSILFVVFRYIVVKYFRDINDNQRDFFKRIGDTEKDVIGMKKDIESNKDDIAELKSEHKENHK